MPQIIQGPKDCRRTKGSLHFLKFLYHFITTNSYFFLLHFRYSSLLFSEWTFLPFNLRFLFISFTRILLLPIYFLIIWIKLSCWWELNVISVFKVYFSLFIICESIFLWLLNQSLRLLQDGWPAYSHKNMCYLHRPTLQ